MIYIYIYVGVSVYMSMCSTVIWMAKAVQQQYLAVVLYGYTYSNNMDRPGKAANSTRGQQNRENEYFPVCVRA